MTQKPNIDKPYVCPYCKKEYPVAPKACSCEEIQIDEETEYYFLDKDPKSLEQSMSVTEIKAQEISKEEYDSPSKTGFYVQESFVQGIETVGSFFREIRKVD